MLEGLSLDGGMREWNSAGVAIEWTVRTNCNFASASLSCDSEEFCDAHRLRGRLIPLILHMQASGSIVIAHMQLQQTLPLFR
jgi:hypothetical protein